MSCSCCPNATWTFDIASFSFQLWAVRDIRESEEITISYLDLSSSYDERKQNLLRLYKFECDCLACKHHHITSSRRKLILDRDSLANIVVKVRMTDLSLPEGHLLGPALERIDICDEEGLHAADVYLAQLHILFLCYVVLGNRVGAEICGRMLLTQKFRLVDPTYPAIYRSELAAVIKILEKSKDVTSYKGWSSRRKS